MSRAGSVLLLAVVVAGVPAVRAIPARSAADVPRVTLVRTPGGGIQPQVAVDATGGVHVLYFKGDAAAGDLFYAHRDAGGGWSAPLRVNSQPGSAMATGSMRGGHLAIGRNGRVHVAWHGSNQAQPRPPGGKAPVLYARLNQGRTRFEPQRNLVRTALDIDGGTVAADDTGQVFVLWHGGTDGDADEDHRVVWMARSANDGGTFARERPISSASIGACGCCAVSALADRQGTLYALYRSATERVHRDTYLLRLPRGQAEADSTKLADWNVGACPMSTFALADSPAGVLAAWETAGEVGWTRIRPPTGHPAPPVAITNARHDIKHPALAGNATGETLVAWTEGTNWNKGGTLAWQLYDRDGRAIGDRGHAAGVPVWGLVAVASTRDGGFDVFY
jgi:hypothetical protein